MTDTDEIAQLLGLTLGLSIAGAVYVNKALEGLKHVLPDETQSQLLGAITGTSGGGFKSLPQVDQIAAADTLTHALRKVLVFLHTDQCYRFISLNSPDLFRCMWPLQLVLWLRFFSM